MATDKIREELFGLLARLSRFSPLLKKTTMGLVAALALHAADDAKAQSTSTFIQQKIEEVQQSHKSEREIQEEIRFLKDFGLSRVERDIRELEKLLEKQFLTTVDEAEAYRILKDIEDVCKFLMNSGILEIRDKARDFYNELRMLKENLADKKLTTQHDHALRENGEFSLKKVIGLKNTQSRVQFVHWASDNITRLVREYQDAALNSRVDDMEELAKQIAIIEVALVRDIETRPDGPGTAANGQVEYTIHRDHVEIRIRIGGKTYAFATHIR